MCCLSLAFWPKLLHPAAQFVCDSSPTEALACAHKLTTSLRLRLYSSAIFDGKCGQQQDLKPANWQICFDILASGCTALCLCIEQKWRWSLCAFSDTVYMLVCLCVVDYIKVLMEQIHCGCKYCIDNALVKYSHWVNRILNPLDPKMSSFFLLKFSSTLRAKR